jgi:hypothetical protein
MTQYCFNLFQNYIYMLMFTQIYIDKQKCQEDFKTWPGLSLDQFFQNFFFLFMCIPQFFCDECVPQR